ncbi:hypothetical protein FRC17_007228 [Serendipita sp. 399]|nr:hypothetical protein FRC17_007228 [Serendipita sp. 399]
MPRYEPEFNQFIVQEDPYAISAVPVNRPRPSSTDAVLPPPLQKKPSLNRVRSNSVSALERLAVFAEATQRVKRRIRNFIGGAMGASMGIATARNKRKGQNAMNVDDEWNGWENTPGYHHYGPEYGPEYGQEYYPVPYHPSGEAKTMFPPAINRYSVNMEDRSISDVSMYDDAVPTPRATTPEPSTPKATRPPQESTSGKLPKKVTIADERDEDEDDEREEGEDEEEGEGDDDEQAEFPEESSKQGLTAKRATSSIGVDKVTASPLSPMEEDPPTPKARSPPLPDEEPTTSPKKKSSAPSSSRLQGNRENQVSNLKSRASSSESSPPKTPKLSLRTDFTRSPLVASLPALHITITNQAITASPEELHFNSAITRFKGLDLMEVVAPSAAVVDTGARTGSTFEEELREAQEVEASQMRVNNLPNLLPAAMITEKKRRDYRLFASASRDHSKQAEFFEEQSWNHRTDT